MPLRPEGVLEIARALKERRPASSGEPLFRAIVGRAYYAAYLATCDAICARYRYQLDSYLPHEAVSQTLAGYQPEPDVRKIGNWLDQLRLLRIDADYKRAKQISEDQSDDAVADAEQLLRLLPSVATKLPKIDPKERP